MSNVIVKAVNPGQAALLINGVTYQADAGGNYSVPEAVLHRVLDMGACLAPSSITSTQLAALATAGRVRIGDSYFVTDANCPVWRNAAGDGWVDGAGDAVTIPVVP